jgi:hypothetical protein
VVLGQGGGGAAGGPAGFLSVDERAQSCRRAGVRLDEIQARQIYRRDGDLFDLSARTRLSIGMPCNWAMDSRSDSYAAADKTTGQSAKRIAGLRQARQRLRPVGLGRLARYKIPKSWSATNPDLPNAAEGERTIYL